MSKKPTVYSNGPPSELRHFVVAKDYSKTVQMKVTFKKGLGVEHHESFRRQMAEMIEATIAADLERIKERSE